MKSRLDDRMLAGIRQSLTALQQSLDREPLILVDSKGRFWPNNLAAELIERKDFSSRDFNEWLRMTLSGLRDLSYDGVRLRLCTLPGNRVMAILSFDPAAVPAERVKLTSKEKEILGYLMQGFSNKKMAGILRISPGTVNTHLDNIYRKLGCKNRVEACFAAFRKGLFYNLPGNVPEEEEPL